MSSIDWFPLLIGNHFFHKIIRLLSIATSIASELSSVPSIQRVATKALHEQITLRPQYGRDEIHIELLLKKNRLSILLDITWEALHKRGYRKESGEAPLKETLAAALVTLSGYRGNTSFYGLFCWIGDDRYWGSYDCSSYCSRTLSRISYFVTLHGMMMGFWIEVLDKAEATILPIDQCRNGDKAIKIFASDSDAFMQTIALSNARRALVADMIEWRTGSFETLSRDDLALGQPIHWVSNPPYGDRMELSDDLRWSLIDFLKHPTHTRWYHYGGWICPWRTPENFF
jgi:putative N6-adenine-specific DNA methylase